MQSISVHPDVALANALLILDSYHGGLAHQLTRKEVPSEHRESDVMPGLRPIAQASVTPCALPRRVDFDQAGLVAKVVASQHQAKRHMPLSPSSPLKACRSITQLPKCHLAPKEHLINMGKQRVI